LAKSLKLRHVISAPFQLEYERRARKAEELDDEERTAASRDRANLTKAEWHVPQNYLGKCQCIDIKQK